MAAPTIYRSTDTSAPTITGESSSFRLALNAILVDGYGSQPAAGWTKPYEDAGNHLVVYRPGSGLKRYLYINDSATRLVDSRGYRSMSSISVGTEPFPGLTSSTPRFRKSVTANNTARPWVCLATDKTFYFISFGNQTTLGNYDGGDAHFAFGELIDTPIVNNKFLSFIYGASDVDLVSTSATTARQVFNYNNPSQTAFPLCPIEGQVTQIARSSYLYPCADVPWNELVSGGSSFPTYPDPSTGKLLIARPLAQISADYYSAGYFPGLWILCHPASGFTTFDTFSGSGTLAGRTFLIVKTGAGGVVFETGGNW